MRMKNTFIYTSLLLILLLAGNVFKANAQQKRIRGPRFGFDVSGLVWQFVEPDHLALAAWADYEVMPAIYATAEVGRLEVERNQDIFDYSSTGYYAKIGADYNFLQQRLSSVAQYDMIYGGLRFTGAQFSHQASNVVIENDFWGSYPAQDRPEYTMNAIWTELVAGLRVEALKNLFLGWSIRAQLMLHKQKDSQLDTWMIPGYGKAEKNTSLSFTYSISYRIPLVKVPSRSNQ